MPIIKSAKKKLRQDKKRTKQNLLVKKTFKKSILSFKQKPSLSLLAKLFSTVDTAAKKKIIHPNKASRLKSRLSKLLSSKKRVDQEEIKTPIKSKSPRKKKTVV